VAGFQTFAHAYGVRMADHWQTIREKVAGDLIERAHINFDEWGHTQLDTLEISESEWVASEVCKLAWRARHPATKKLWYGLQDACTLAIRNRGAEYRAGKRLKVRCVSFKGQRWMVIALPSGRFLTYFDPKLTDDGTITYMGEASEEGKTTRQWIRVFTHGGKVTGNVCQTLARDVLAPSIPAAEAIGFLPVLTVHDELVTEAPDDDEHRIGRLVELLAKNPPWSTGLPLSAAGFEAPRYKKD
jgi:DNA polymerase